MSKRLRFDVIFGSTIFYALIGLGVSCALIALQVVNPSRQILSLTHYLDYYFFFNMGQRLMEFCRLGELAALLMLFCFVSWAAMQMQVNRVWRGPVPLGRLLLLGLQVLFLHGVACQGCLMLMWVEAACGPSFRHWYAELLYLPVVVVPTLAAAAFCVAVLRHGRAAIEDLRGLVQTWSGGVWSAGLIATVALLAGSLLFTLVPWDPQQLGRLARPDDYLVPPFLWTHFGPWGILLCVTGTLALLGVGVGIALYGLVPDDREPWRVIPLERAPIAFLVAGAVILGALSIYAGWLVPRYQIGQDLRRMLGLTAGAVPGRTVVWLDAPRSPQRVDSLTTWSTAENVKRLGDWMLHAPHPSAQTKPAAAVLGDRALWDWEPEQALHWLDVQRERQLHDSNLNAAMAEILRATMPTAARDEYATAFTDSNRFAWPGYVSALQVGALLHRYGHEAEAQAWLHRGVELAPVDDAEVRQYQRAVEEPPPSGEIRGRLTENGRPLAGVKVALFHSFDDSDAQLLELGQRAVERDASMLTDDKVWKSTYHYYMNLRSLRAFYAVRTTDKDGSFRFAPLDRGHYLLAARLDGSADVRVEDGAGIPLLAPGRMRVDVGELRLKRP